MKQTDNLHFNEQINRDMDEHLADIMDSDDMVVCKICGEEYHTSLTHKCKPVEE